MRRGGRRPAGPVPSPAHTSPCFACRSLPGDAAPPKGEGSPFSLVPGGVEPTHILPQPQPARSTWSHGPQPSPGHTCPSRPILPAPSTFVHQPKPGPPAPEGNGQVFRAGEELIEAAKRNNFCKVLARGSGLSPWQPRCARRGPLGGPESACSGAGICPQLALCRIFMAIVPFCLAPVPVQLTCPRGFLVQPACPRCLERSVLEEPQAPGLGPQWS